MHWLIKALIVILGNALALWLANHWVSGFILSANLVQLLVIGLILAILNFLLKPLLALVLGPIILITLGLGIIIVNAIILYLLPILANHLDFLRGSITIQSIPALFLATIIVSVVNFVIHLIA
jgi:putative membrane protein